MIINGSPYNDYLTDTEMNDTINGGGGNDVYETRGGNDTYILAIGGGKDLILMDDRAWSGDKDTILVSAGIAPSQVSLLRVQGSSDLIVRINTTGDEIRVQGQFSGSFLGIEEIKFADGTVWGLAQINTAGYNLAGSAGNDTLNGSIGNDTLNGGAGNDLLDGRSGSDTYVLALGGGSDRIAEGTMSAPTDVDTLAVSAGISTAQVRLFRELSDLIIRVNGSSEEIRVSGQFAQPGLGIEQIKFADGTIWGANEINAAPFNLTGTAGSDVLLGGAGNDILNGGAGNDLLDGRSGSDTYVLALGGGSDRIAESTMPAPTDVDTVAVSAGISTSQVRLFRDSTSPDLIIRVNGSGEEIRVTGQFAQPGLGIEQIQFADGTIWGANEINAAAFSLTGTAGNDFLAAGAGNDILNGGAGNDLLDGREGSDTYVLALGGGSDLVAESTMPAPTDVDTVAVNAGISASQVSLFRESTSPDLIIRVNDSGEEIRVAGQFALPGLGIEQITFADGSIWGANEINAAGFNLTGTAGDDLLIGDIGDDTLDGGAGNDLLDGRSGSDTYVLALGGGSDLVAESTMPAPSDVDTVSVSGGISASQVDLIRDQNSSDLIIRVNGSNEEIRVAGQFAGPGIGIEQIKFADGTVWGANEINAAAFNLTGTAGSDVLLGDIGNDTLDGSAGNDLLDGRSGSDTYVLALGSGSDLVAESTMPAPSDIDTVAVSGGISASQVDLIRDQNSSDLIIRVNGSNEEIRVAGQFAGPGVGIEQIKFSDGTIWGANEIDAAAFNLTGTAGSDVLLGGIGNDTLDGGAGNDLLDGYTGSDSYVLALGSGSDLVTEYAMPNPTDVDTVSVSAGISSSQVSLIRDQNSPDLIIRVNGSNEEIRVAGQFAMPGFGIEQVKFADGTIWGADQINAAAFNLTGTAGNDVLNGHIGNDTLDGGAGNDLLDGRTGSDTYVLALGSGSDLVTEDAMPNPTDVDTVSVSAGISSSQVSLLRDQNSPDLIIRVNGSNEEIRVAGQFFMPGFGIEQIKFADGTIWGADQIYAAGFDLTGTAGDDFLIGEIGNDILDGGAGNDLLDGRSGSDTYVLALGGGSDMVAENTTPNPTDVDTVSVSSGINTSAVSLVRDSYDLMIRVNGSGEEIRVANQFAAPGAGIEQIQFADGTIWGANEINAAAFNLTGTGGSDFLIGGIGNDTLDGGAGNDLLDGRSGSDTYVLALGGGSDMVAENTMPDLTDVDTVSVSSGINTSAVSLVRDSYDLMIRVNGSGEEIRVANQFAAPGAGIEQVKFADGTSWGANEINAAAFNLTGTAGSDFLAGGIGNDTLNGGAGNDVLDGRTGSDTYVLALGGGSDLVIESTMPAPTDVDTVFVSASVSEVSLFRDQTTSDLTIRVNGSGEEIRVAGQFLGPGIGIEQVKFADGTSWGASEINAAGFNLSGTAGNDFLAGGIGNDTLNGDAGNDNLVGGIGNDQLFGGIGADVLIGGIGKDLLSGGTGNDRFDFDALNEMGTAGANWDVITDFVRGQDKIDLTTIDANSGTTANDAFAKLISANSEFSAAGQLKFANGVLYGNTDSDADADFAIQLLGITSLTKSDFLM